MRRLARPLFTVASAVSLVLCLAACVLWVRSYWDQDAFSLMQTTGDGGDVQRARAMWTGRGLVGLIDAHFTATPVPGRPWAFEWSHSPVDGWARPSGTMMKIIGFGYREVNNPDQGWVEGYVPLWLPAGALAALPAALLFQARRQNQRLMAGHCTACGYDLRASPDRCPECGAATAAALTSLT